MANDADVANEEDIALEEEIENEADVANEEEIENDALKAFKAYEAVPCNEPVNEVDIKLPLINIEPVIV